jgi:hypothetical protein
VSDRQSLAVALLVWAAVGQAAPPDAAMPRMTIVEGKDVDGTLYKKVGLPSRQYCWDACLKEDKCSGVRWGVVGADEAGLCLLLTGPLSLKALTPRQTDDGKAIHVTVARKVSAQYGGP